MTFDTQLKDRLDSAAASMPGEPLDLMTTLTVARRSRRNYRMVAAIAAAAVLVAGGVTAAVTIGGPEPREGQPVIGPEPRVSQAEAFDAVADFLSAINLPAGQKTQAMWDMLSPVSQAYFENDIANFDPVSLNGETLGAYDFATERNMHLFFLEQTETLGVVTITGNVTREGFTEQDGFVASDPRRRRRRQDRALLRSSLSRGRSARHRCHGHADPPARCDVLRRRSE